MDSNRGKDVASRFDEIVCHDEINWKFGDLECHRDRSGKDSVAQALTINSQPQAILLSAGVHQVNDESTPGQGRMLNEIDIGTNSNTESRFCQRTYHECENKVGV